MRLVTLSIPPMVLWQPVLLLRVDPFGVLSFYSTADKSE